MKSWNGANGLGARYVEKMTIKTKKAGFPPLGRKAG